MTFSAPKILIPKICLCMVLAVSLKDMSRISKAYNNFYQKYKCETEALTYDCDGGFDTASLCKAIANAKEPNNPYANLKAAVLSGSVEEAVAVWNNDGKPIFDDVRFNVGAGTATAGVSCWNHKQILADEFIAGVIQVTATKAEN